MAVATKRNAEQQAARQHDRRAGGQIAVIGHQQARNRCRQPKARLPAPSMPPPQAPSIAPPPPAAASVQPPAVCRMPGSLRPGPARRAPRRSLHTACARRPRAGMRDRTHRLPAADTVPRSPPGSRWSAVAICSNAGRSIASTVPNSTRMTSTLLPRHATSTRRVTARSR